MGMMYFGQVMAAFLMLEGLQCYALLTNMVEKGGLFLTETFLVVGWLGPVFPTGLVSLLWYDHSPSDFRYIQGFPRWVSQL